MSPATPAATAAPAIAPYARLHQGGPVQWTQIALVLPQALVGPISAHQEFAAPGQASEAALLTTIVVTPVATAGHALNLVNLVNLADL